MVDVLLAKEFDFTLEKLRKYCVYQERCHQEVRNKCVDLELRGEEVEKAIATLIEEGFLNEQRFAEAWVGGKMRIKKWGKYKIRQMLLAKRISEPILKEAFLQYTDEVERQNMDYWMHKKMGTIDAKLSWEEKMKATKMLIQKGFDQAHVMSYLEGKG